MSRMRGVVPLYHQVALATVEQVLYHQRTPQSAIAPKLLMLKNLRLLKKKLMRKNKWTRCESFIAIDTQVSCRVLLSKNRTRKRRKRPSRKLRRRKNKKLLRRRLEMWQKSGPKFSTQIRKRERTTIRTWLMPWST